MKSQSDRKKETYEAQGICLNCGRRNYPQWGIYEMGKKLEDYPCPNCGNMTWVIDKEALQIKKSL